MWPPLGLASLATVLRNAGEDARIFDSSFDPSLDRVKSELGKFRPELVGIYTLTNFFKSAKEMVQFGKGLGARTALGAAHPTLLPEQTMQEIPDLDFVVRGEGEIAILELVKALSGKSDFSAVPGLGFRKNSEVILNPLSAEPLDLDRLPIPDRSLFDRLGRYLRNRAMNLHISRGCPFNCSFCQPTLKLMFGKKLRYRSAGLVVEELKQLHSRYGIHEFFFHDDIFTVNRNWLRELAASVSAGGLRKGFRYVVNSRVDTFDQEVAELLKEMGVYYVLFGLESGSQEVLDRMNKGTTLDQAYQAFALCRKFGFRTHAYIIIAGPGETRETLKLTEKMLHELKPDTVHISICTPLPGTDLAKEAQQKGMMGVNDYMDMDYLLKTTSSGQLPLKLPGLTYQEVLAARERILKQRRWFVFKDNLAQLIRDFIYDPSPSKFIFRLSLYRQMKHCFG